MNTSGEPGWCSGRAESVGVASLCPERRATDQHRKREQTLKHYEMNIPAFSVAKSSRTEAEAQMLIASMRSAGLHPLDLATASHFSLAGAETEFQIEVPTEELNAARELLQGHDDSSPTA